MVAVLLLVSVFLLIAALWVWADRSKREQTPEQVQAWEHALSQEDSIVGRILQSLAQPVSRLDSLQGILPSRQYRWLQRRLLAANKFGGEVDIFLSVQAVCFFIASALVVVGLLAGGAFSFALWLLSFGLLAYPWNIVAKAAEKKSREVTDALPEFAELLQMVIASGSMGLEAALGFTAERVDGPVSDEVRHMLLVIRNNPSDEQAAYLLAGERLGTPEAKTFFSSILQAQLDGAKILENLQGQARGLRTSSYQRQRGEIKKMPVRLVVMFGIHLFPLLFVAALLPTLMSLSRIGQP